MLFNYICCLLILFYNSTFQAPFIIKFCTKLSSLKIYCLTLDVHKYCDAVWNNDISDGRFNFIHES